MPDYGLNFAQPVTLDGSGNGTVSMGPSLGQVWRLTIAAVRVNTAVLEPECRIYIGAAATDEFFVDGTFTGSLDSSDSVASFPITNGQKIFAKWIGGDPGATATLSVLGSVESGRGR